MVQFDRKSPFDSSDPVRDGGALRILVDRHRRPAQTDGAARAEAARPADGAGRADGGIGALVRGMRPQPQPEPAVTAPAPARVRTVRISADESFHADPVASRGQMPPSRPPSSAMSDAVTAMRGDEGGALRAGPSVPSAAPAIAPRPAGARPSSTARRDADDHRLRGALRG